MPPTTMIDDLATNDLEVGERILRRWFEEVRYGRIAEIYESKKGLLGQFHYFYAVTWEDTGRTERGYMRIGLEKTSEKVVA